MNQEYFAKQFKQARANYVDTIKKIISIEEEIEKKIFYLQSLDNEQKEKMYNMYKDYLQNLNTLRDELSSLMKDNLLTTQSFFNKFSPPQNSTSFEQLGQIYQNLVKFFLDSYNPFFWIAPDNTKSNPEKK